MVNGVILTKFDEQINLTENIFKKYFKLIENIIKKYFSLIELNKLNKRNEDVCEIKIIDSFKDQLNKLNKRIEDVCEIKIIDSFKAQLNKLNKRIEDVCEIKIIDSFQAKHTYGISSVCLLKDKRLVSGGYDNSIIVYNTSHQSQIYIKNAHSNEGVKSLCVLRNGELLSVGGEEIKIWRISNYYQLIHTLIHYGYNNEVHEVNKVIESKDGKLFSCSENGTIKIWNNYQCIETLNQHSGGVKSLIEINNCIISVYGSNKLRIWDKSTYKCIKTIKDVQCYSSNGLSKLNDNTVIVGGDCVIYLVDIKTYQINQFQDYSLGKIYCSNVNKNGLLFVGNDEGEIFCYSSSSNKIIFKNKFHYGGIYCIIEGEDNKIISSSIDKNINIYNILLL